MKLLILLFKWHFKIVYFFLKLIPINKNKITFLSRQGNNLSLDFKLLKEELMNNKPNFKTVFLCRKFNNTIEDAILYYFHIYKQMYHLVTSRVCIVDSYIIPVSVLKHKKGLTIIQIWHALGAIKKFGHDALGKKEGSSQQIANLMNMHKNYDYIICGGKSSIPHFSAAFNTDESKIKPYGLPRVDYLLNKEKFENNRKEILKKYKKIQTKKTILYAPTFRKGESLEIDKLIKDINFKKYNLIIKKHPLDKTIIPPDNNIIIDENFNILKLLSVADYVITDYSALAFETAILEIPLYFYVYDIDKYENNRGLNIDLDKEMKGTVFKETEELLLAIEKEEYNYKQLIKFKDRYVEVNDKSSTGKILELIELIM